LLLLPLLPLLPLNRIGSNRIDPAAMAPAPADDTDADAAALTEAWTAIHQALDTHILSPSATDPSGLKAAIAPEALACLQAAGLGGLVLEYVVEGLDAELRREVAPRFWAHFDQVCVWVD
jgi:hypothetical protein